MDRGAWWATVHRVAKIWIQLSDFNFINYKLNIKNQSLHLSSQLFSKIYLYYLNYQFL